MNHRRGGTVRNDNRCKIGSPGSRACVYRLLQRFECLGELLNRVVELFPLELDQHEGDFRLVRLAANADEERIAALLDLQAECGTNVWIVEAEDGGRSHRGVLDYCRKLFILRSRAGYEAVPN